MEGILQTVVGANLGRIRRDRGHSQESLGAEYGWHRTFVGAVERGERNLTLRSVERISDQLGVHPLDLLWDRSRVGVTIGADGTISFGEPSATHLEAAEGADPTAGPSGSGRGRKRSRPRPR